MQYFMVFAVKMIYLVNSLMVLCEILNITSMKAIQSISYWQKTETFIYLINIPKGRSFVTSDNFYGSNKTIDKIEANYQCYQIHKVNIWKPGIFFRNTNENEFATNRIRFFLYVHKLPRVFILSPTIYVHSLPT